ncbi:MAG: TetR/AcrR family transcriptional regulator [Anaerolineae bacterium]|nr:TetR/AcrR family transcriptional regulator [Anaerolineae bacterium]
MRKGERTRSSILAHAIDLFNTRGYAASSLSDVMRVTGLQKGGIYNHFESKEALALEAFDYAFGTISKMMWAEVRHRRDPLERLRGILAFFHDYFESSPFKGGCVLLNAAIESDDAFPALRKQVQTAMDLWRKLIRQTVQRGIDQGVLRSTLAADAVATIMVSTLEGAYMMTRLYGDSSYLDRAFEHLNALIEDTLKA